MSPSAPRPPRPSAMSPQRPCQHRDPSSRGKDWLAAQPRVTPAGGSSLGGNKSRGGLLPQPGCPAALPTPLALLPGQGDGAHGARRPREQPGRTGAQPYLCAHNPDCDLEGCSELEQMVPRPRGAAGGAKAPQQAAGTLPGPVAARPDEHHP